MSKISITRALAEIKSLDGRIEKRIEDGNALFITLARGRGDKRVSVTAGKSIAEITAAVSSDFQSLMDLFKRRDMLKAAVIASNAVVRVTIGSEQMTVAEAIERKNSIKAKENLHRAMRGQYITAVRQADVANAKLAQDIENAVNAAYGSDKVKPTPEMYDAISNPRRDAYEVTLVDPLDLSACIDSMAKNISEFLTEVDFVLSESNARTEIDVA